MATFPVTLRAALSGQTLAEVEVYADDTVQALRAALHSQEGGCMVRCDFLFGGKVLVEHELLGDAGVQPGGVVDVLRSQGPWLAAACADGAARLWDLSSGDCFKTLHGDGAGLRKVVLLADQQHVLTGSDDGTAILWNLGGAGHRTLADHGACVTEVSASPDSKLVLTIAHGELRALVPERASRKRPAAGTRRSGSGSDLLQKWPHDRVCLNRPHGSSLGCQQWGVPSHSVWAFGLR
ncbi:unnamed protein product [Symbiodinium sp. CCMP2592]|nr:unnamed protein product [Symbiodinium sp. CCMP2592]